MPSVATRFAGRPVVVVAPSSEAAARLAELSHFIREQHPVLVGVDAGVDLLVSRRLRVDLAVVDGAAPEPDHARETTRPDPAPGTREPPGTRDRFRAALLLAERGGAELVIPVGAPDGPSWWTARQVAPDLVVRLYGGRVRTWQLVAILAAALLALVLAVATTPIGNVWWHDFWDLWRGRRG